MFSDQEIEILSVLEVSDYCFELAKEVGIRNAELAIRDIIKRKESLGCARDLIITAIKDEESRFRDLALVYKDTEEFWKAWFRGESA